MTDNKYISVKVTGRPESAGGYGPFVMFNDPTFPIEDIYYVGFDIVPYFFVLKIFPEEVIYILVRNKVRSNAAIRQSTLQIGISIPKGFEMDNGQNPYKALIALQNEFLRTCASPAYSESDVYEFNKYIDPHALDEVAKQFTLTAKANCPYHPMTLNGSIGYVICKDENTIEELLSNVQYPEFKPFKEVLVSTAAVSTASITYTQIKGLTIPRQTLYKLIVDGKSQGAVSDYDKNIPINVRITPRPYYNITPISFTISDLENKGVPGVTLDKINETIVVNTNQWTKPKKVRIKVVIVPKDYANYFKENRFSFNIICPNRDTKLLDENMSFTLVGSEIGWRDNNQLALSFSKTDKYKIIDHKIYGDEWRLTVGPAQANVPDIIHHGSASEVVNVKLLLTGSDKFKNKPKLTVRAKVNGDRTILSTEVSFAKTNSRDEYEGHLYLPKRQLQSTAIFLEFVAKNMEYYSNSYIPGNHDVAEFKDKDFRKEKLTFLDKHIKAVLVICFTLVIFIVGGFAGYGVGKLKTSDTIPDTSKTDSVSTPVANTITKEYAKSIIYKIGDDLKKDDLTFDSVVHYKMLYYNNKELFDSISPQIVGRIKDYYDAYDAIQSGDIDAIGRLLDKPDLHIYNFHKKCLNVVCRAYYPKDDYTYKNYNRSQKNTAKNIFERDHSNYRSFKDLLSIQKEIPTVQQENASSTNSDHRSQTGSYNTRTDNNKTNNHSNGTHMTGNPQGGGELGEH